MQTGSPLLDGRRAGCGRNHLGLSPAPHRCGSSMGEAHAVPNWPSSPPTAITASSRLLPGRPGSERPWNWRPHRKCHAEVENAINATVRRRSPPHPSGSSPPTDAWLAVVMAHNLARWTANRPGREIVDHQDPQTTGLRPGRSITRSTRRLMHRAPAYWPWETQFSRALARLRAIPLPA